MVRVRFGNLAAALATTGAMLAAAPAVATVKGGVDAWDRGDYASAVAQWRGPAVAGDADAEFNLGQAYKLGRGVPVDPVQAENWFKKAATQGHLQAGDNYGLALFQEGRRGDALPWLEKSAARGEPRAQLVLGTMLFNGDGVSRDYPRAYALMTRAAAANLPAASQTLAQMDQYISTDDRARGTAMAQQMALRTPPAEGGRIVRPAQVVGAPSTPRPQPAVGAEPAPATRPTVASRPVPAPRATPTPRAAPTPRATPTPRTTLTPHATPAARLAPAPHVPTTAPAGSGRYRVQLGAFRDRGNAEALWSRIRGRMTGAQPFYVAAGGLTRLQVGGYASKAEAVRACAQAKAGGAAGCVVVAP